MIRTLTQTTGWPRSLVHFYIASRHYENGPDFLVIQKHEKVSIKSLNNIEQQMYMHIFIYIYRWEQHQWFLEFEDVYSDHTKYNK